ncbi:hypothetical protein AVEN_198967-1 [Araneus ventricosus]|uniref:Uncharacterized protein n=1 Tax=Araneus ventricosus TaxID=182803 RepID=A0A4Y2UW33_ARAVE|nr:hypothetical protein AVEN_198967-1 [Araneus ventricosus]
MNGDVRDKLPSLPRSHAKSKPDIHCGVQPLPRLWAPEESPYVITLCEDPVKDPTLKSLHHRTQWSRRNPVRLVGEKKKKKKKEQEGP